MVRPYQPSDLPVIMDIADRAWRPIFRMFEERLGPEVFAHVFPESATMKSREVEAHCAQHPDWMFVCGEDGRIVGFSGLWLDEARQIGVVGNNAVDPDCGLKGIGQQLYAAVLKCFREHDMKFTQVLTGLDDAHAPARRAYERAGFDIRWEWVYYYQKL